LTRTETNNASSGSSIINVSFYQQPAANAGDPLPDDTYFYVLRPEKSKPVRGYIVVKR